MQIIPIIERADMHGIGRLKEYNSATRTLEIAAACFTLLTGLEPGNVYELTAPLKLGLGDIGPDVTYWFFEWSKQE
jgi:hypothetical protein